MKRSLASLLALFAVATAHAGSFGGPPPFKNGSPLVTGVDGTYQASARSENMTGIFRFAYNGGSQTSASSWIFFVAGQVQRGTVTAAINKSSITGVLDSGGANFGVGTNGQINFPIVLQSQSSSSVGYFNGKLDLTSPYGVFSGSGQLVPAGSGTNDVTIITQRTNGIIDTVVIPLVTGAGSGLTNIFKFQGVRTSTTASTN